MAVDRFVELSAKVKTKYPRFTIKYRDKSWLMPLFWVLQKVTKTDYSTFIQTIFTTMYVGSGWDAMSSDEKYARLRHEMKHIRQFYEWPLGAWAWPVNHILTAICYLFILPVILTFRSVFEREAYIQTLLVHYELEGVQSQSAKVFYANWLSGVFGGSAYLFMWRRQAAYDWTIEIQNKIEQGLIVNNEDRIL